MATDRITIGLTSDGQAAVDRLMSTQMFKNEMDVAKLGLALMLSRGIDAGEASGPTKWNVGSFDTDGLVRNAVRTFLPDCTTPYRKAEALLNRGVLELCDYLQGDGDLNLDRLLKDCNVAST